MSQQKLNLNLVDKSWLPLVKSALSLVEPAYLKRLEIDHSWLPGHKNIFNAFSLPVKRIDYILFGESPYPRVESANGYAFWDNAVHELWSEKGMSKEVNRATSLRNLIKMLLVARGDLEPLDVSQSAIAAIDKSKLIDTADELFQNFMKSGFMLLNASLVLSENNVRKDSKAWHPFMNCLLEELYNIKPNVRLVLFGQIAKTVATLPAATKYKHLQVEHPYNISFINNHEVIEFFKPFDLLGKWSRSWMLRIKAMTILRENPC